MDPFELLQEIHAIQSMLFDKEYATANEGLYKIEESLIDECMKNGICPNCGGDIVDIDIVTSKCRRCGEEY